MSLQVSNLLKIYGVQKAVNNISFSVGKGEIVGFLGPNGAGKSTTMKIITGYLSPDAGTAAVCGIDVQQHPLEVKKKIGYLPEANPLYYDMYVQEYVAFVAGVHKLKDVKQRVEEVIEMTGLTAERKKKISQLSKGYKQRVGLAASLVHSPEVLILDEPTSGLDPNQVIEIRNLIKEQGKNKTVLFSSHILQEVQAICDRVIIINKGELVADDNLVHLQQGTSQNIIHVSFKAPVNEALLKGLPALAGLVKLSDTAWQLSAQSMDEARKQLLEMSVRENLDIVSLGTKTGNLEEIFRTLTQNKSEMEE
ncbi:MAG TPA: gliding motility-associated ABC transporter ATP-binding subunit GldA [Chitinophagaceae bacterium]|nr:gliding motility-associated ABC transporter ATP-binding subunit GldA [Chitinophagaceae bacterium]